MSDSAGGAGAVAGAQPAVDPRVLALCGYRRKNRKPNLSDSSSSQSVLIAERFFEQLGVPDGAPEPADAGAGLADLVVSVIRDVRPDLTSARERHPRAFSQYEHLAIAEQAIDLEGTGLPRALDGVSARLAELAALHPPLQKDLRKLQRTVSRIDTTLERYVNNVTALVARSARHSLLGLDVAVSRKPTEGARVDRPAEELLLGISCKWTLRTDRGQDAVAQGDRLASHRRGPMPRYGVVTMECRPYYLAIVAEGSAGVDAVYHPALLQVRAALESLLTLPPAGQAAKSRRALERYIGIFDRLVSNGRLRPLGDLAQLAEELPRRRT